MATVRVMERKSRALRKACFGCLKDVWVLNITRGCSLGCVYCYARGYQGAPPSGGIELYGNLPFMLQRELDSSRRRSSIEWVAFNTASDSFQPHPLVQEVSRRCIEILAERGIGISILTKGWLNGATMDLLKAHKDLVHFQVGLISADPEVLKTFEPHAAPPQVRLRQAGALARAGAMVCARVDPVIPFVTDCPEGIKRLMEAILGYGIKRVTVSYLHMRPRILQNLKAELPDNIYRLIVGCYWGRDWQVVGSSTKSKLLPKTLRARGYERFRQEAERLGMELLICSCKNPDIPAQICSRAPLSKRLASSVGRRRPRQLSLFSRISQNPVPGNSEGCPSR